MYVHEATIDENEGAIDSNEKAMVRNIYKKLRNKSPFLGIRSYSYEWSIKPVSRCNKTPAAIKRLLKTILNFNWQRLH